MFLRFSVFISIVFISACQPNKESVLKANPNYFDLKSSIKTIENDLSQQSTDLIFVSTIKEKKDSVKKENPVWEKEFELFEELDLTNPKYKGSFAVDSLFMGKGLLMRYSTKEEKSKIKTVEIFIRNNSIESVFAQMQETNFLYTSNTTLYYEKNNFYSVESFDKFNWFSFLNSEFKLKGYFVN